MSTAQIKINKNKMLEKSEKKITNEKGEITTNTKEIQTILKTYYEQVYILSLIHI